MTINKVDISVNLKMGKFANAQMFPVGNFYCILLQ